MPERRTIRPVVNTNVGQRPGKQPGEEPVLELSEHYDTRHQKHHRQPGPFTQRAHQFEVQHDQYTDEGYELDVAANGHVEQPNRGGEDERRYPDQPVVLADDDRLLLQA